ncbi:MAG: 1,4-dihydroxy-2-naphthoate polyprenyltransferase [Acidobacteria bacterium]|nr:MAG: 1,4-dihydroxy-2-naphthoate polyprenyltransferase [Acidobacteriota bacterium]REK07315.1 MAG: 1,4-dihydroxy-2-naphthoate polyprenyltransferase [Acidobacteriota bacterium]
MSEATAVAVWVRAARPATLWAAIGPVAVGAALAQAQECLRLAPLLAATWGAIWIQIGTNFANDLHDHLRGADGPNRLGPARAVAMGWISAPAMRRAVVVAFAAATAAGLYLTWVAGWWVVWLGVAAIAAGVLYTAGPRPLAYIGVADLFVLAFFGFAAVVGTVAVQCAAIPAAAWWAGLAVGCLNTAILVVNNLRDRAGDAAVGKRTLAVRFGAPFARAEYALLHLAAYLVCAGLAYRSGSLWLAAPLLTVPIAWRNVRALSRLEGRALNPLLGGTARLVLAFSLLLALGLVLGGVSPAQR